MNLQEGQAHFQSLVDGMDKQIIAEYLRWVKETAGELLSEVEHSNADTVMEQIQEDLRQALPPTATLPSETITMPAHGQHSDLDPAVTVHVDGFLYDDDVVDRLCDEGAMSRNYCKQCGSHQVAPLSFISHSTSLHMVKYMFQHLLPDLTSRTVVDVGSRTGAVLYGAYMYSGASRATGVEISADFCQLQQNVIDKYNMQDRLKVICDDICAHSDLLKEADVIVMSNVFEFFVPLDIQKRIWQFLYETLRKPGSLIVLSPSLEASLKPLGLQLDVSKWVQKMDVTAQQAAAYKRLFPDADEDCDDLDDIHLYQVL